MGDSIRVTCQVNVAGVGSPWAGPIALVSAEDCMVSFKAHMKGMFGRRSFCYLSKVKMLNRFPVSPRSSRAPVLWPSRPPVSKP